MELIYHGYKGELAARLSALGAEPGDMLEVELKDGEKLRGILMPRQVLYADRNILVLKLENGYNVGLRGDSISSIRLISKKAGAMGAARGHKAAPGGLPKVTLIGTGGTIASKVDYETGAVTPVFSIDELLEWLPELGDIALIRGREIMKLFSEDMKPSHWELISQEVYKEMREGADGVVIAHGTDTMSFSASALAFSIANKPVPVVFVGSQRSSDRPSSDSDFNLLSAFITAARAPFAESVIVMHAESSDTFAAVHRGVKVRKMHTSRRDAFQSINDKPIAIVNPFTREIKIIGRIVEQRDKGKEPLLRNKFDERVALVKFYPGLQKEILDFLVDKGYHGIVIEGSGLGHISNDLIDSVKRATESGIPVVIASQCLFGRVNLNVYSTGRRLLEAGAIPASDMLPEVAYVKLSWILGSLSRELSEVRKLVLMNFVGEINERITQDLFPRWSYE